MQLKAVGSLFAPPDAAPAISLIIQRRGKRADTELPRKHGQDASADAAFGGQTDAVTPFAGVIVHAATVHDAEDVLDVALVESALAGQRVDAIIGQGCSHDREVAGADQDRTLLEIEIEVLVDRLLDHAEIELQITDRAVAVTGRAFGNVDAMIDLESAAG